MLNLYGVGFIQLALGVFKDFNNGKGWDWGNTITVTLAGFLIVFIVLILLIILFTIFGKIMKKVNEKEAMKAPVPEVKKPMGKSNIDDETAAVITAAITQAAGGKKFIIKEIKEAKK